MTHKAMIKIGSRQLQAWFGPEAEKHPGQDALRVSLGTAGLGTLVACTG